MTPDQLNDSLAKKEKTMHTPGPWKVITGAVYRQSPTRFDGFPIPIAHMDREIGNGTAPVERDANARLIAAAPQLLEALEGLTQLGMTADGGIIIGPQGWSLARAAIAAAKETT